MSTVKYIEIANIIDSRIDLGHYATGSKLPTHRALANELGTTPVTVSKAYQVLASAGKIESFVGRGSYVYENKQLSQVIRSGIEQNESNLSILQPCLTHNIKSLHSQFQNSFSQNIDPSLYAYAEGSGLLKHRDICRSWAVNYGLDKPDVEQLHLVNGAQHALSALIQLYTKPEALIAVEAQTYPGILSIANFLDRRVVGIHMDEHGMRAEALEQQCIKERPELVIVVPSHQNPTGATMSIERREAIANVILKNDVLLVEDDIYAFLNPTPLPAISNLIPDNTFHISSLSKAISPGMRCGFLRSPKLHGKKLSAFLRAMVWLPSPLLFETASQLVDSGLAFSLAEEQKQIAQNRQHLARRILQNFSLAGQATSYQLWLTLPKQWNADSFCLAAKNQGMLVSSSTYFGAGTPTVNNIRLSLMAIESEARLTLALENIANLLDASPTQYSQF
ncbi:PLP-dependent aminotransferase family protein [Paraglaciecola arctica]|uniref:aminotransferase-like domain-containing protein n=1 Tax=Paraglaciecola arctica TaxID=1128911 RepID=UPI001C06B5C8|nr:PLP-dependent aminotransferase family protein [Paraglaciecola arctica]MBU3001996.1 PLP-dependent aminotransferase family protein [Paraglaciecola arctica]